MRITMMVALLGRRFSEICLLDHNPRLPLLPTRAAGAARSDETRQRPGTGRQAPLQQTKIDGAPNTILVHAEVVAIVRD